MTLNRHLFFTLLKSLYHIFFELHIVKTSNFQGISPTFICVFDINIYFLYTNTTNYIVCIDCSVCFVIVSLGKSRQQHSQYHSQNNNHCNNTWDSSFCFWIMNIYHFFSSFLLYIFIKQMNIYASIFAWGIMQIMLFNNRSN